MKLRPFWANSKKWYYWADAVFLVPMLKLQVQYFDPYAGSWKIAVPLTTLTSAKPRCRFRKQADGISAAPTDLRPRSIGGFLCGSAVRLVAKSLRRRVLYMATGQLAITRTGNPWSYSCHLDRGCGAYPLQDPQLRDDAKRGVEWWIDRSAGGIDFLPAT